MAECKDALTEAVYYVLLSLFEPNHGYGIMKQVEEMSGGRVKLGAGTLYGALGSLTEKGLIRPLPGYESSRRKAYVITDAGKKAVYAEVERLRELCRNGEAVLEKFGMRNSKLLP